MYSITQSPTMAIDLAHAIQDEHLRHAPTVRRTPKRPARHGSGNAHWSPTRPFTRRPAALA